MKLYATVSSERATKGQGGNNYLDIEIMGENKVVLARVQVKNPYPGEYEMNVFPVVYPFPDKRIGSSTIKLGVRGHGYILKREKQKGENQNPYICSFCGLPLSGGNINERCHCD